MTGLMLDGKATVITGAGRGIGKACARVFTREGAKVLAVDFSGAEQATASEIGNGVTPFHADLTRESDIEAMFAAALEKFGRVDAVLNVAGSMVSRPEGEVTLEDYEEMTAVNLRAVLFVMKHAVRAMLPAGRGAIVNFSSVGGLNAEDRARVAYSAAKAGVHSVTKSFAVEYGGEGIRTNCIAPGFTLTELTRQTPPEMMSYMCAKSPMGRGGEAEEQAEVAAFLASDRSSFVNGAIIPVDGGWSARLA